MAFYLSGVDTYTVVADQDITLEDLVQACKDGKDLNVGGSEIYVEDTPENSFLEFFKHLKAGGQEDVALTHALAHMAGIISANNTDRRDVKTVNGKEFSVPRQLRSDDLRFGTVSLEHMVAVARPSILKEMVTKHFYPVVMPLPVRFYASGGKLQSGSVKLVFFHGLEQDGNILNMKFTLDIGENAHRFKTSVDQLLELAYNHPGEYEFRYVLCTFDKLEPSNNSEFEITLTCCIEAETSVFKSRIAAIEGKKSGTQSRFQENSSQSTRFIKNGVTYYLPNLYNYILSESWKGRNSGRFNDIGYDIEMANFDSMLKNLTPRDLRAQFDKTNKDDEDPYRLAKLTNIVKELSHRVEPTLPTITKGKAPPAMENNETTALVRHLVQRMKNVQTCKECGKTCWHLACLICTPAGGKVGRGQHDRLCLVCAGYDASMLPKGYYAPLNERKPKRRQEKFDFMRTGRGTTYVNKDTSDEDSE